MEGVQEFTQDESGKMQERKQQVQQQKQEAGEDIAERGLIGNLSKFFSSPLESVQEIGAATQDTPPTAEELQERQRTGREIVERSPTLRGLMQATDEAEKRLSGEDADFGEAASGVAQAAASLPAEVAGGAVTGVPQATGEVANFVARLGELAQPFGETGPVDVTLSLLQGEGLPERGVITENTQKFADAAANLSSFLQESVGLDPDSALVKAGELLAPTLGEAAGLSRGTKAAQKFGEKARRSAESRTEKILSPTKESEKVKTERILPELTKEMPVAKSRESLLEKFQKNANEFGEQIDYFTESGRLQGGVERQRLVDIFENAKEEFRVADVDVGDDAVRVLDELQETVQQFPEQLSPEDTLKLRRVWDKVVSESNGFQKDLRSGSKINFQKDAANDIRRILAEDNPDLAEINKSFALWKTAEQVLRETAKRKTGQSNALVRNVQSAVGAVAGGAGDGGVLGALGGAAIAQKLGEVMNSTLWKTIDVKLKNKLADSISKNDPKSFKDAARTMLNRVGVAVEDQENEE